MNTKRYRCVSQYQFQLDSISNALHTELEANALLGTDSAPNAVCTLVQTPNSVQIGISQSKASATLEFAPLFPGSFTQSDVTVNAIACSDRLAPADIFSLEKVLPKNPHLGSTPRLGALEPTLHFARFNSLPGKLATSFHTGRRPITIIIDESDTLTTNAREVIKHQLRQFIGKFGGHQDIVVVQLKINATSRPPPWFKRRYATDFQVSVQLSVHGLVVSRPEQMVALLAKSKIALVPSVSLAMDAINAGCAFFIYGEKELPDRISQSVKSTGLETLRLMPEEQRTLLAQYQLEKIDIQGLIVSRDQMYQVLREWLVKHQLAPLSRLDSTTQPRSSDAIIPANSAASSEVRKHIARAHSKCRKLLHSPRQFLQDSSIPGLRRLSTWGR